MTEIKKTRSELKREAIVSGAIEAFQKYGVSDTSMDKVAETAGVSKRTVYNHFQSKEILVTEIIKDIWSQNFVSHDYPYNSDADIRAQLFDLVIKEIRFLNDKKMHELIRVAMGVCLFNPEKFVDDIGEFFEQETTTIRWLKAAMQDGKLKAVEPRLAHDQLVSLLKGQAFWPQILHQAESLNDKDITQLAQQTIDFFLSYYLVK